MNKTKSPTMAWSNLDSDLLCEIARNLTELTDQIRFRCVCSHWRSSLKSLLVLPQPPWLLLPSDSSNRFYSFSDDHIYSSLLPDPEATYIYGSGNGWVLALKGHSRPYSFELINPFTAFSYHLPPLDEYCSIYYANPSTIVWDCSKSIFMVASRSTRGVYYYHFDSTDGHWLIIESLDSSTVRSIQFHYSSFDILDSSYKITVLEDYSLEELCVVDPPPNLGSPLNVQMFSCYGDWSLRFVAKYRNPSNNSHFYKIYSPDSNYKDNREEDEESWGDSDSNEEVERQNENYDMDSDEEVPPKWKEITNIGNHALFLDRIHCIVEVGKGSELIPNCIYAVEYKKVGDSDSASKTCSISFSKVGSSRGGRVLREDPVPSGRVCPPTWILPSELRCFGTL